MSNEPQWHQRVPQAPKSGARSRADPEPTPGRRTRARAAAAVRGTTRLTCSLGVATSKVVAKVASDSRKPGGITVVRPGGEAAFLAQLPVRKLPGVGPRSAERLAHAGVDTVGALAALTDD